MMTDYHSKKKENVVAKIIVEIQNDGKYCGDCELRIYENCMGFSNENYLSKEVINGIDVFKRASACIDAEKHCCKF